MPIALMRKKIAMINISRLSGSEQRTGNTKRGDIGVPAVSTYVSIIQLLTPLPGTARGAGMVEVEADEVVRVLLENSFALWCRADTLICEPGRESPGSDGFREVWEIDVRQPHCAMEGGVPRARLYSLTSISSC